MEFPKDLLYTKEHEWLRVVDNGENAYIGITDYAQKELDELVFVEVETVGEELETDDVFGIVEAVKITSDLYMPVSGEVLEFNNKLSEDGDNNPALINEDPYNEGWIIKIKLSKPEEVKSMMSASDYEAMLA